jgi:hypothetical protein
MNFATDIFATRNSVALNGGNEGVPENPAAVSDPFVALNTQVFRDVRWCSNCAGPRVAIDVYEIEGFRLVACQGCGEEKFIPFTRSILMEERTGAEAA